MRLRCTRTQRRPTSRSSRISTRPLTGFGEMVPEIAIARPWRTRREERPMPEGGEDADRDGGGGERLADAVAAEGRADQAADGERDARGPGAVGRADGARRCARRRRPGPRTRCRAGRRTGEEPSGKRSRPESRTGRRADAGARRVHGQPGQRARVARGAGAQVGQLGVEDVAGAGGRVAVAVARDALERHRGPARIAVRRAAARGHGRRCPRSARRAARASSRSGARAPRGRPRTAARR